MAKVLRKPVRIFAESMEDALLAHDGDRGRFGWDGDNPCDLFTRLLEEVAELNDRLVRDPNCHEDIRKECADVGNFAMMIADLHTP